MYDNIIKEWQRKEAALRTVAALNTGPLAMHLEAQAEGYELAAHSFDALKQDHEGAKGALTLLEETQRILKDAATVLPEGALPTIADTVSVCLKTLRVAIPQTETTK